MTRSAAAESSVSSHLELILKRRSIRYYQRDPVPSSTIRLLLEACRWAPSGGNRQPWHIIVINDPNIIALIKTFSPGILGDQPPLVLALIAEQPAQERAMDIAMAAENIWLVATSLGLGACAIGSFNNEAIREILEIPSDLRPLLLMTIGYPKETPKPRPRKSVEEITSLNRYGNALVLGE